MQPVDDAAVAIARARELLEQGHVPEAERMLEELAAAPGHREAALGALTELYLTTRRPAGAVATLRELTEIAPETPDYAINLAMLLERMGRAPAAIREYERLLERSPRLAAAHFNLALLYKREKRFEDAIRAYREAARLGIGDVQEVWSNLGVLYAELRRRDDAKSMYERALAVNPDYVPALFNLAALYEETGDRQAAVELYRRILALDPGHRDALARIAHATRVTAADDELLVSLREAVRRASDDDLAREGLWFALGKALDDRGEYEEAFAAYREANELGKRRLPRYDRGAAERAIDALIEHFDPDRIRRQQTGITAEPVFICGMFRSGSTLLEQIVGAHPAVTPGGELDILPWLVSQELSPFPERLRGTTREELTRLANEYLTRLHALFPGAGIVTDKRPDNFAYLGLVKTLFPRARIVFTRRNPLDTCLSVYFQQLGGNLAYSTDLEDTAHYYEQHERLMEYWSSCFADSIAAVDYDALVRDPEPAVRELLGFLGLPWDPACLDFRRTDAMVKTASVWQVREDLHERSSGRWRNYESRVDTIRGRFPGRA